MEGLYHLLLQTAIQVATTGGALWDTLYSDGWRRHRVEERCMEWELIILISANFGLEY